MVGRNEQAGLVILGSIFLGVWVFGLLFGFDGHMDVSAWLGWGLVGLVLAAAAYGIRATEGVVNVVLLASLGVVATVLFLAALMNESAWVFAALCTAVGAGLVAAALPPPRAQESPKADEPWPEA